MFLGDLKTEVSSGRDCPGIYSNSGVGLLGFGLSMVKALKKLESSGISRESPRVEKVCSVGPGLIVSLVILDARLGSSGVKSSKAPLLLVCGFFRAGKPIK